MSEIKFAGAGDADVKLNITESGDKDTNRSSEKALMFAGDGAKDVAHSVDTTTKVLQVEHTKDIQFAG